MSGAGKQRRKRALEEAPPSAPSGRWPMIAGMIAGVLPVAAVLLYLFSPEISDTDFWWHLKAGRFLAQHHALPVPDPFAYTTPAGGLVTHFNLTHEWLSQLLMYLVYAMGGFNGVILARAVLLGAVCGLAGWLAARLSRSFYAGLAASLAAASVLVEFTADRPGVVSFLGVAVFVCLLEARRGWWALPAIALVWANCHGGFPIGWVVLAAYCMEEVVTRRGWRLVWISLAAIAVSGLNPNGFQVIPALIAYRRSPLTASLIEWRPASLWGPPYSLDLLLYAAALVLVLSWRRVRPAHWILFAAFAAAALTAFRNAPLVAFLAPVLIAAYFPWRPQVPRALAWVLPFLMAAVLVPLVPHDRPKFGVAGWTIPAGAADYLAQHPPPGAVFNTYEQGGYLIWRLAPETRVFIDGRSLGESVYRDYRQILFNQGAPSDQVTGPRAELFDRYGIRTVVMNTMDYVSGAMYPLALALGNPAGTDWQMVYDDAQAVIFERNPPAGTPVLSNKLGRVLRHMGRECSAYIENDPEYPLCARTLARYWMRNEAPDEARRMLTLYLQHAPRSDEEADRWLGQLLGH